MITNNVCSRESKLIAPLINLAEGLKKTECSILLDTVETIALNALEGLKAFKEKKLALLDPSIGDESCQIRAFMILQLANQETDAEVDLGQQELQALCKKIQNIRLQFSALELELVEMKKETNQVIQSFAQQKKCLNSERDNLLSKVEKGTSASKEIWDQFKKDMRAISEQEDPIRQKLTRKEQDILAAKIKIIFDASLDVDLSKVNRQIVLCYILTKIGCKQFVNNANGSTYYVGVSLKNLQVAGLTFQASLFETLVAKAKRIVNLESMEFLAEESKKISGKRSKIIQDAMQIPLASAKEGFREYSFYHGLELIIKRAKQLGIPILVKSRKPDASPDKFSCKQLYLPNGKNNKYIPSSDILGDKPALVIEGVSQKALDKGLSNIIDAAGGLMKMLRLNLAQHRFCTSQTNADANILRPISEEIDSEIERINQEKKQALDLGYSQVNQSSFMVDHVYADLLVTQN